HADHRTAARPRPDRGDAHVRDAARDALHPADPQPPQPGQLEPHRPAPGRRRRDYGVAAVRRLQALLVGALLAGAPMVVPPIAAADGFASADCADADLVPGADNLPRVEGAVLCLINRERAGAGLVPLTRSIKLDRSARFHSVEMVTGHF